ncbi:hypothetical protein CDIK_2881 [Cucumispora dikerogammari]|nr:hypothetical protein CDIK_2881 [Cucumispora dikerogammari]
MFERAEAERIVSSHYLPGHIGFNNLRDQISRNFISIPMDFIKSFIASCLPCQRETIPTLNIPLTPIVPSYIRKRLLVDTVDLTEYCNENIGINTCAGFKITRDYGAPL